MGLKIIFLALAGVFVLLFFLALLALGESSFGRCVGVIELNGEVVYSREGFFGVTPVSGRIIEALEEADERSDVASVLFEVNSPGGSAVASKEIYDAVAGSKKPVVAYLGEVAASGGYYVASAADWIVANPNTITGSIGARATVINYAELLEKIGVREEALKTGEMKDIGAGYRNMTEKERQVLGALLNETFDNFRSDVLAARGNKINPVLFAEAMDARILSAKQAQGIGLVDELGSRRRALEKAASLGNITEAGPEECFLARPSGLGALLSGFFTEFGRAFASGLGKGVGVRYE